MFCKPAWLDPVELRDQDVTGLPFWPCKAVGGTTCHWAGASLRFQPPRVESQDHLRRHPRRKPGGLTHRCRRDAPLLRKGRAVHESHRSGSAPAAAQYQLPMVKKGADNLGLHLRPGHMAVNATQPYDGRPMSEQQGYCFQGCNKRAMWSTFNEAIPKALATGYLELRQYQRRGSGDRGRLSPPGRHPGGAEGPGRGGGRQQHPDAPAAAPLPV